MTGGPAAGSALRVSVERVRTGVAVVRAVGELDPATAPGVLAQLRALHSRGLSVVLDLSDVCFLADTGLDGLVEVLRAARARGLELRVVLCSRGVEAVVRAAGLDGLLPISRTLPEAVALVGVPLADRTRQRYARALGEVHRALRRTAERRAAADGAGAAPA